MYPEIYDPQYVQRLFDAMSSSYERMNYITSFGFSSRWRKQCLAALEGMQPGWVVADLMTGMGENWEPILRQIGREGKLIALDFSEGMLKYAEKRKMDFPAHTIHILHENVFASSIPSSSVDCVTVGFGIKTLSPAQLREFVQQIKRILKPNGGVSLVEISTPSNAVLRFFYLAYLKRFIPILGWLFLGNPEAYRMLGTYTERFCDAREAFTIFSNAGFAVEYKEYFYGCATGITGTLPSS